MSRSAIPTGKRAAYQAYKPSGVAWLGEVPEHWEVRRFKHTADLINVKVDGADNNLPYTGLEHIESWTGRRITANGNGTSDGQANIYHRGDVLFGKLRPYLAKAHAAESDGICTGELLVLRPRAVAQEFLLNYVLNQDFVSIVDSSTYGAKMPRANWDFIGNLPALIPPSDEQRAIAAFLDRETVRIDALIEKKRRQIELLQEKRSTLIGNAVTKGLHPNVSMKDSGIEWLGEIPSHWKALPLKRVCQLTGRIGFRGYSTEDIVDEHEGAISLSPSNMVDGKVALHRCTYLSWEKYFESPEIMVAESDILLVKTGSTYGKVSYVDRIDYPQTINPQIMIMKTNSMTAKFVFYVCNCPSIQGILRLLNTGSTIPTMTQEAVGSLCIPLPSDSEQREIVKFLDKQLGHQDEVVERIDKSIIQLREFRAAMISAAVTGKIDVRAEAN